MDESTRYRTAGAIYFVLGITIMMITVLTPELASPERRVDLITLLIGLPFFGLFALLIAYGDRAVAWLLRVVFPMEMAALGQVVHITPEKAAHAGRWTREKLVMLLTLSALGRTFVFAANGFGWKPGIAWRPFAFAMETVPSTPRMLINAALMAIILITLARVSWVPFLRRLNRSDPTQAQS